MTTATITIEEAQEAILRGTEYGDVWPLLPEVEREALAHWFCRTKGLPNIGARDGSRRSVPTGETCPRCGGFLVRTGTCMTCQGCGESSGGCG